MIWDLFENCTNQTFLNQQLLNLPVLDLWQIRYPPKKTLFIHLWAYVKRPTSKTGFSNRFWNCQFATYVKRDTSIFYLLHCYLICVTELTSFLAEQSSSSNWVFCENSPLFSLQGTLFESYYLGSESCRPTWFELKTYVNYPWLKSRASDEDWEFFG